VVEKSGQLILVVEDEAIQALDIEQMLAKAGYQAVVAINAPMALQKAASWTTPPRAAIIDLHLPKGSKAVALLPVCARCGPDYPLLWSLDTHPKTRKRTCEGLEDQPHGYTSQSKRTACSSVSRMPFYLAVGWPDPTPLWVKRYS
jgi:CheY-like chemotaxis protein